MDRFDTDIVIAGGGVAGLTATAAFASAGFSVVCVDPAPPVTEAAAPGADLRTTAFLQPAREVLRAAGLWDRLLPYAAPLQVMRIVDAGGETPDARVTRDFDAAEISDDPFGWNLPNWLLRRELLAQISDTTQVTFLGGVFTQKVTTRETGAKITLSNGKSVRAKLVVGADGRNSAVRTMAGIGVKTWRYGQMAVAFSVTHPVPHQNVSTEIHRHGGPFTLVPLPDLNGVPCSAVVWMEKTATAQRLADVPVSEFNAAITRRSCNFFGPLTLVGRRTCWPIISQLARRITAQRTALIAEAAHVVPPIGAQGLNMSLADLASLLDLAKAAPQNLGDVTMLARYQRARLPDITARVTGIDALNRVSMAKNPVLRDIRQLGLKTLHGVTPLRKTLMRTGLGAK